MKLTRIIARGFKGRDFDIILTPATVLFGGNFRGKTRVMDAIRLALLGYLPELGKGNRDTFGLASGQEMEVIAEFDSGLRIRRRWTIKGNSVTTEVDGKEAIAELGDMAVMLNADEYFGLTDRARVDYVFARCPIGKKKSSADVVARIQRLLDQAFGPEQDAVSHRVLAVLEGDEDVAAEIWLEGAIERLTESHKTAKAVAIRAEKTIQQLTDMRLRDEPTTPVAVLEEKRAKLVRELAELNEKKGRVIGSFTQMKADAQRRAVIGREIAGGDKNRLLLVDMKEKLRLITETLATEETVTQEMIQETAGVVEAMAGVKNDALRLKADAETAKGTAEKQLFDLDGKDSCPYCGAQGDGWKTLKAAELATEIDRAAAEAVKQNDRITAVSVQLNTARDAHLLRLQQQRNQQQMLTDKSVLLTKITQLEPQVSRLDTMAEELNRLMKDDPAIIASVETLQTEVNVKNSEIRELEAEITKVNGRTFELKRQADAEKERDDARLEQKVSETAGKELRLVQGEMVAEAFAPLLERANSFFGQVLKSPLAYNAAAGGEIGTWRDGLWVGHRTFSGTEKALTYAAIQAALAMTSPFRMMLVDELGRLDDFSVDGVLNAVLRAIDEGRIDGFVGIDTGRGVGYKKLSECNPSLQVIEIK